jgi:predicted phage tail protein
MLRKVKLYGELAEFVGHKELDAVVKNAADAIRFLISNFPKLEAHMNTRYYQVLIGDYDIDETEIHNPIGNEDISIVPVISGAGGGLGKTLLGIALIGIAIAAPGAGFLAGGGFGFGAVGGGFSIGALAGNIGIGLTLMGVSEMLFPQTKPEMPEDDPRISFSFSGVQNTSRAGTSHPIVYGEVVTGSVVISAGIDTDQVQA